MAGRLTLCATPIGNLGDASPRLAEVLAEADLIYAEDTRRTATLLRHFGITTPLRSYFAGNEEQRATELAAKLETGATIALVTDAGTPVVADPGYSAVRAARRVEAQITVVPGPSAVTAALAVSGMSGDRFVFDGFLPRKGKERRRRIAALVDEPRTIVLFCSSHRIAADLAELAEALGPERPTVVCRELTKLHEEVVRTTLGEAADTSAAGVPRGEFTVVIAAAKPSEVDLEDALAAVTEAVHSGTSLSQAVRTVAATHGTSRRRLYQAALEAGVDTESSSA